MEGWWGRRGFVGFRCSPTLYFSFKCEGPPVSEGGARFVMPPLQQRGEGSFGFCLSGSVLHKRETMPVRVRERSGGGRADAPHAGLLGQT